MTSSVLNRNHVHVAGDGASTVVFGHGFGTDQTIWRQQVAALGDDVRIVLFDHVGCGQSDLAAFSPVRYRTMYSYADDLGQILEELDLSDVYYIGHSMSVAVGMLAYLQAPERFARIVSIVGSPRYLNEPGYHGGFEQADLDALFAAMAANYEA